VKGLAKKMATKTKNEDQITTDNPSVEDQANTTDANLPHVNEAGADQPVEPKALIPDNLPVQAVFIGHRGQVHDNIYQWPGIYNTYLYYRANGTRLDPSDPKYFGKDPRTIKEISMTKVYTFKPGDMVYLPHWDDELMLIALATGDFGVPDEDFARAVLAAHEAAYQASEAVGGDLEVYAASFNEPYAQWLADKKVFLPKGWTEPEGPLQEGA
jgi:hypothetical protein